MDVGKLGAIEAKNVAIAVCDLQEKFEPSILHWSQIVSNSVRIVKAAQLLNVPVLATEQYPKGLGSTVEPLKSELAKAGCPSPVSKTKFTMIVPEIEKKLEDLSSNTIVLCGIEAHVCVVATCIDLIARGFQVHVVADAVSSRTQDDRKMALERMRSIGAHINTTESLILSLVGDASHPQFKPIQQIIKELSPTTNLF